MLKKVSAILIAVLLSICPLALFANSPTLPTGPEPNFSCPPAAAPTNFVLMGVMPTSISIAWSGADAYFYRVETTDETAMITYPPKFVGHATSTTIDDLIEAHQHTIRISASNCPDGPWGPEFVSPPIGSGTFIVEDILALNQCTPPNNYGGITERVFCVSKSATAPPLAVANVFIGKIKKTSNQLETTFGVAYYDDVNAIATARFGKVGNVPANNYILSDGDEETVHCFYQEGANPRIHIFTLELLPVMSTQMIKVRLIPVDASGFTYSSCGDIGCSGTLPGGGGGKDRSSVGTTQEPFIALPSPNPFSESTALRYELTAPEEVSIHLYDAIGKLVKTVQETTLLPEGEHTATISGADLRSGTYFAVVQKGAQRQVVPLIKQD